jgi:DnaJ homolog subfamily A member 5
MSQFTSSNKPQVCLYELLGLEQNCNQDEIKKAYRLMARKHHPDKNGNTDEATRHFQAINNANTVLSDPQERAWYDDHREDILYGASAGEQGNDDVNFDTSNFVSPFAYDTFQPGSERSFWEVYHQAFEEINRQEQIAHSRRRPDDDKKKKAEFQPRPPFGGPTMSVAETKRFYNSWFSFTTKKTYSWKDEYDTREANGRRMRRAMDKENTKARSAAKKKFVDSVHRLIRFVSRRDPRVKAYREKDKLEKEVKEKQRERDQQRKKENRQRAMAEWKHERMLEMEQQERDDEQARREGRTVDRGFSFADEERAAKEEEEEEDAENGDDTQQGGSRSGSTSKGSRSVVDEFECPACNKRFKSSQQWENHQKSKKHKKNVEQLKRELMAEDAEFDVDELDAALGISMEDRMKSMSKKERRKMKQRKMAEQEQEQGHADGKSHGVEQDAEDIIAGWVEKEVGEDRGDSDGNGMEEEEEVEEVEDEQDEQDEQDKQAEEVGGEDEEEEEMAPKKISKKEKKRRKEMARREAELNAKTTKKKKKKKKKSKGNEYHDESTSTRITTDEASIDADRESKSGDTSVTMHTSGETEVATEVATPVKKLTKKQIRRRKLKEEREAKEKDDERLRLEVEAAEAEAAAKAAAEAAATSPEQKDEVGGIGFEEEQYRQEKKKKKKKKRQEKNNFKKTK